MASSAYSTQRQPPLIATIGPTGAQGPTGATGTAGANGAGVPIGGATGTHLVKSTAADYDTSWQTVATLAADAAFTAKYAPVVLGVHSLTTAYVTSGTHTTAQDEGLTLTLSPPGSRRWKFTANVIPYVSGGANGVTYTLLGGGVTLRVWTLPTEAMATANGHAMTLTHTEILATAGATVYKLQIQANPTNTAVNSHGAATQARQLIIEDIGIL